MQVTSARGYFEEIAARGFEGRLQNAKGAWQFEIEGEGVWQLAVDGGRLSVHEGSPLRAPQVTIHVRPDVFLHLVRGDDSENLVTAYLRGALQLEGDIAFSQRLMALIPLPDQPQAANTSTEAPRRP